MADERCGNAAATKGGSRCDVFDGPTIVFTAGGGEDKGAARPKLGLFGLADARQSRGFRHGLAGDHVGRLVGENARCRRDFAVDFGDGEEGMVPP